MARGKKGTQSPDAAVPDGGSAGPAVEVKSHRRKKAKAKAVKTDARSIRLRENMAEAMDYRKQGYSYREISVQMKRPISTLQRWVSEAVRDITEERAETMRNMMLQRLDDMMVKAWARFEEEEILDAGAMDAVLKLDDRRARILGLYNDQVAEGLRLVGNAVGQGMMDHMRNDAPVIRIEAGTPLPAIPKL